jgi:hypothetical protein
MSHSLQNTLLACTHQHRPLSDRQNMSGKGILHEDETTIFTSDIGHANAMHL